VYYLDFHGLYKSTTKEERIEVRKTLNRDVVMAQKLKNQHNLCFYCATEIDMSGHLDHLIPVRYGGTNRLRNLVAACRSCNMTKMTDQIEITNPYTIKDYLRKQYVHRKWRRDIKSSRGNDRRLRRLYKWPPKGAQMYTVFRADLFKEI